MNLIVTCARNFEDETLDEITKILKELGDENHDITKTGMRGILTVVTKIKPLEIVEAIRSKILDEPWSIRYCLRIIPIQSVAPTNVDAINSEVLKLIQLMDQRDSYRITIEKRNSNISKEKLISEIAKNISNKVSLEEPNWIVLIEILGNDTGISVLRKNSILSVEKTKRSLSE